MVSVNYMRHTIFEDTDRVGALDMGGASTQITFSPVHDIIANFFNLRIRGENIRLYTHSYLQYGRKQANLRICERLRADEDPLPTWRTTKPEQPHYFIPCYPTGFNFSVVDAGFHDPVVKSDPTAIWVGRGDYETCASYMYSLLNKNMLCTTHSCSFAGTYEPRILEKTFVGFGNFAVVILDELKLSADASLDELERAARRVCAMDMDQLAAFRPGVRREKLAYYCFNAAWAFNMLHNGYGFSKWTRQIHYEAHDLGQLGAMMYEANLYPWAAVSVLPSAAPAPSELAGSIPWSEDFRFVIALAVIALLSLALAATLTAYCSLRNAPTVRST